MINAVLRLRKDTEANYAKVKDTFVPANGEVCLVDTDRDGLRAVCGDGKTPFGQLSYFVDLIQLGYYVSGKFYKEASGATALLASPTRVYIDIPSGKMYYYEAGYREITVTFPVASATTAGIAKLYDTTGGNTDGSMTQKSITDALNKKAEVSYDAARGILIIS